MAVPEPMLSSFADIPGEVARRVRDGERVLLILLDAFGLEFLHRHERHPLLQRLQIVPLGSQCPSTTTAHVTTAHFGLPVEDHGLYGWNILEPTLGEIICPLRFNRAGTEAEGTLAGELDPAALAPGPTFYEQLGIPAAVFQPRRLERSTFTRLATRGASLHGFDELQSGLEAAVAAIARADGPRYAFVYWDTIDFVGHKHGPSSPQFGATSRAALDAVWNALCGATDGLTILITADHGQIDVSPERVDYLDDRWPELGSLLSRPRPAGSSRDTFLHVRPGNERIVIEGLEERLGDRARVMPAGDLFPNPGPRLKARLGDVVVLPSPGREVWLRSAQAGEQWFRGQHGGLEQVETATYLARVID